MSDPFLDLIIAVHSAERPIGRAVASAVEGMTPEELRVTVVCHGLPSTEIHKALGDTDLSLVRLIEFSDGVRSPAGPFNTGLDAATGRYVAIMGSDDFFEPGALAALIWHARRAGSDVVLAKLRLQDGEVLANPLTRFRKRQRLNVVRDRLFYRSAPLGLLRRDAVEGNRLRMTERMPVGEDLAFGVLLWCAAERIDFPRDVPAYVIGADAEDRVTMEARPIAEAMAPVLDLLDRLQHLDFERRIRQALAIKILRIHVLGAVAARPTAADWREGDLEGLVETVDRLMRFASDALEPFARSDRVVLDLLANGMASREQVAAAQRIRSSAGLVATLVPRNPWRSLNREGTLVRYLLYRFERSES